eukprot:TRINITY_DN98011_c0_g1_i1.p2 TRINITY_DN98011_c0_g1~~TRINITY_DN98011_c0_g1_i1.p2  ORF type:complete len:112 (+),score=11.07 TRINITY_DN98011_c0_g1_i1:77-412(+)
MFTRVWSEGLQDIVMPELFCDLRATLPCQCICSCILLSRCVFYEAFDSGFGCRGCTCSYRSYEYLPACFKGSSRILKDVGKNLKVATKKVGNRIYNECQTSSSEFVPRLLP